MNNLTSLAWWQSRKPAAPDTQPTPALTPEQIIATALKTGLTFTQGNLLDLCRQHGADISYATLRSHLTQLQQQGAIAARFSDQVIPGLSVLVYYRIYR